MKNLRIVVSSLVIFFLFMDRSEPCGPYFEYTYFRFLTHPDLPLTNYVHGKLGVIEPSFRTYYLVVAYRYLSGNPLSKTERKAILDSFEGRIGGARQKPDGLQEWFDLRKSLDTGIAIPTDLTDSRQINQTKDGFRYMDSYLNCSSNAFHTAALTLKKRVESFGAKSREVSEWTRAQDIVFQNCSNSRTIPPPASAHLPVLIQKDRSYQIAASHFYAGDYEKAEALFRTIASDRSSPWRCISRHVAARAMYRSSFLSSLEEKKYDYVLLSKAEEYLIETLQDPSFRPVHSDSKRLLGMVRFRLRPEQRLLELAHELQNRRAANSIKDNLQDYFLLFENPYPLDRNRTDVKSFHAAKKQEEMTSWIATLRDSRIESLEYAVVRWRESRSIAWLVASLVKAKGGSEIANELIDASVEISPGTPEFATLFYHSIRLLLESGRKEEARQKLSEYSSSSPENDSPAFRNRVNELKMKTAESLNEFLDSAPRISLHGFYQETLYERSGQSNILDTILYKDRSDGVLYFDGDAAGVLNTRMPLRMLYQAVQAQVLPAHLQRELTLSLWVRSSLLGNEEMAVSLISRIKAYLPNSRRELTGYAQSANPEERKFIAALVILRNPGLKPFVLSGALRKTPRHFLDSFRENWWGATNFDSIKESSFFSRLGFYSEYISGFDRPELIILDPDFLTEEEKQQAHEEIKRLTMLSTAPNLLSGIVIEWALNNKRDRRLPEALHRSVRSTRYGSTDEKTGTFSKQAWMILHKRYSKSPWADKTPYWFDDWRHR